MTSEVLNLEDSETFLQQIAAVCVLMVFFSDILAGRPARPSTTVPGHWLLNVPSTTSQVYIRRFRASDTLRSNRETLLDELREDPLERAWRMVNSSGEGHAQRLLEEWCCAIGGEKDERELWCFDGRDEEHDLLPALEGLEGTPFSHTGILLMAYIEVLPSPSPINVVDLLDCPQHGRDLSCLKARLGRPCSVHYRPMPGIRLLWEVFTNAVIEKLAWKSGHRVVMRPGTSVLRYAARLVGLVYSDMVCSVLSLLYEPHYVLSLPVNSSLSSNPSLCLDAKQLNPAAPFPVISDRLFCSLSVYLL